jgi:phage terminase small subunit
MPKLDNLQYEVFAQEFSVSNNGTQAAIKANYSERSASTQASRMLKIDKVKARIDELLIKTTDKLEITRERVLAEYGKLAFLDPKKLYDEDGSLKSIHDMDDDTAAAITSIEVASLAEGAGKLTKIKVSDKKGALDSLAKTLSMFTEKHEHTGKDGKPLVDERELATRIAFALQKGSRT